MRRFLSTILTVIGLLTLPHTLMAQKVVREENYFANRYYHWQRLTDAEVHYRKALEKNPKDPTTLYNLSNLLYRTDRGEENARLSSSLLSDLKALSPEKRADVTHNAGNSALRRKDYANAVELFKESLRNRPSDDETRYNLALAQKLLEKQKNEEQQQDQKKDQDKDQNKDRDKDQQDNQPQKQDKKDKPDKPQEQPQNNQQDQMSRQNAEQILKSFLQDEKKTQKKVEQAQQQKNNGGRKREKNW